MPRRLTQTVESALQIKTCTMKGQKMRRGFHPLTENELGRLTFHGAAGEVTGSCFLLETPRANLLFECGMFQGGRKEATRNRQPFPFDPAGIDAVVLTHAHIDHSGLLPKLIRDGYRGPIHATQPTCDLLHIMWPDSAHIQAQDAEIASRKRLRRGGKPITPLYTPEDAQQALDGLVPHAFDEDLAIAESLHIRFHRNGHILGAASVEVSLREGTIERTLLFSGDVGRTHEPILLDPNPPAKADLVILESTYGDRDHRPHTESLEEFTQILVDATEAGQNVIVPVFAVGRAQEVLYYLGQLERSGRIPARPVYLDSPMAINVTELSRRHGDCFKPAIRQLINKGGSIEPAHLQFCHTPAESMAINDQRGVIILAASGMCEAGRVVHHLKHNLWRTGVHVIIVGFQARGTTGRALVDGARRVRILGEEIAVKAQIHTIGGFSAHGGQSELLRWIEPLAQSGARVALVHGEAEKRDALAACLAKQVQRPLFLPAPRDRVALCKRGDPIVWQPLSKR